ncbi:PREDICTED: TP53-target gene 5 protein [Myotis davidii]|uniref:TP53-target gene 5 protein n=1 Tax=Myotis davidii TaxID=225400 RepID=UPI0003EC2063|nr:PREDICTED: TP53-target gene 5 protein [Myotis davidii]
MQDEEPQDKIQQPISKLTERNRLRMVLKNLSLLRLLKNSNPRIQELYSLARRCWNSLLNVPKVLQISSRNNTVCTEMGQNNGLQEAKCSKKKLESKNLGKPKKLKSKVRVPEKKKVQQSRAAVPDGEQVEPEVPKTSITCPGAWGRQLPTGDPGVIFLKPHQGDTEQLQVADQWNWFEGLPRRIHLPGPRVMCRPSTMRLVKRCCTRFCSASLGLLKSHPYRTSDGSQIVSRGWKSYNHLNGRVGWENLRVYK